MKEKKKKARKALIRSALPCVGDRENFVSTGICQTQDKTWRCVLRNVCQSQKYVHVSSGWFSLTCWHSQKDLMFPWILLLWFSVISFLLCFLLSAQVVRRHHSSLLEVECGSARWLTHHLGEHIFLSHHLYVHTSGVPPPALVTQWPPLWCSLETKITKDWSTVGIIWCLSACLGHSIILDVTMVSSAEIS